MSTVLVVEDDAKTLDEIRVALLDHGCEVDTAQTGHEGLTHALARPYDAVVLDRMLPGGMEGLEVLGAMRRAGVSSPVMILSALSAVDERVKGLRAGGDDYLVKPFEFIELTARLDSLVRRSQPLHAPFHDAQAASPQDDASSALSRLGPLTLDRISRVVTYAGRAVDVLPREYRILEYLLRHAGQVVSRTMLFEAVWDYRLEERTNVIDVHISRLRKKLDDTGAASMIHTVRGSGYSLRAPD